MLLMPLGPPPYLLAGIAHIASLASTSVYTQFSELIINGTMKSGSRPGIPVDGCDLEADSESNHSILEARNVAR